MITNLTDWWSLLSSAEKAFCLIGSVSNLLFVFYLLFYVAGGDDTDHDFEEAHFSILSIRGILAFGMFMGWTALVVSRSGVPWFFAALTGVAAGWLAAWIAWRLIRLMLTWQSSGTLDIVNAIGKSADVHLFIPETGKGTGKVTIEVQGALRELDAVTTGTLIPTGGKVVVVGIDDSGRLIVESSAHH